MSQKPDINVLAPAPVRTPLTDSNGMLSSAWVLYFQKLNTRIGGSYSQTVTQINTSVTNVTNSTITTDLLSDGGTGQDYADEVEELKRLVYLDSVQKEDPDNFIPEVPQYIDPENPTFVTVALSGQATATAATAGAATALPATPLGYLILSLNGTNVKVPYYAV